MIRIAIENKISSVVIVSQRGRDEDCFNFSFNGYDVLVDCLPEVSLLGREIFLRGSKSHRDFEPMSYDLDALATLAGVADKSVGELLIDCWDFAGDIAENNINSI